MFRAVYQPDAQRTQSLQRSKAGERTLRLYQAACAHPWSREGKRARPLVSFCSVRPLQRLSALSPVQVSSLSTMSCTRPSAASTAVFRAVHRLVLNERRVYNVQKPERGLSGLQGRLWSPWLKGAVQDDWRGTVLQPYRGRQDTHCFLSVIGSLATYRQSCCCFLLPCWPSAACIRENGSSCP